MTGIIEHFVQVESRKSGDFLIAVAQHIPYAKVIGYRIVIQDYEEQETKEQPESPSQSSPSQSSRTPKLSRVQKLIIQALENGHSSNEEIQKFTRLVNITRAINSLKRKKFIKGASGSYLILERK